MSGDLKFFGENGYVAREDPDFTQKKSYWRSVVPTSPGKDLQQQQKRGPVGILPWEPTDPTHWVLLWPFATQENPMPKRNPKEPWLHEASGFWCKKVTGKLHYLDRDY